MGDSVLPEIFKTFHKVRGNSSRIYDIFFLPGSIAHYTVSFWGCSKTKFSPWTAEEAEES